MGDYDKYNNAVQAGGNALIFGLAGIVQIAKVIKFDRCKIYVCNNHIHEIKIALDDENTEKVMSLIEALEELDDVSSVYHNLEI